MKRIVVLSGAGISAESGLKTFRDSDGLWENYRIEDVATPQAWKKDRRLVLQFYNERRKQVKAAKPNAAHLALVQLEEKLQSSLKILMTYMSAQVLKKCCICMVRF